MACGPRATSHAVVMILLDQDRVLAARRGPAVSDAGYWTFPTGTIEPGESAVETVVRELHEELCVRGRPVRKVWECHTDDGRYLLHWWIVTHVRGQLQPDGNEIDAIQWVDADTFMDLRPTFVGDRRFVRDILPTLTDDVIVGQGPCRRTSGHSAC